MASSNGTQQSQAQAAAAAISDFLSIAPDKPSVIYGTVPAGVSGGAVANVQWQRDIPISPAFCVAIEYQISLPVTLTLAAGASATVSPFAPYSAVANQLTLGGAPPWPLTELLPWYLDSKAKHINYDPAYPGYGNNAGMWGTLTDQGPDPSNVGTTTNTTPGTTITNSGTAAASYNITFNFRVRQQLQRKRHMLWGSIPMGDPENRPDNLVQVLPLIGTNPEQALFVNSTSTGNSCVIGTGGATVKANYILKYIDLLPPSMQSTPNPSVGYGLQLVQFSAQNLVAGNIAPVTHRTAMIYTDIHQLLVNGQLPLRTDYVGLWDDQDEQSARWAFDAQKNTLHSYFTKYHDVYRHYPLLGHYFWDFEGGIFPEIPSVTPYDALMSPDASYAGAFGVEVTPAMTTALRVPAGTTTNSPYIRNYSIGLVRVPF